MAGGALTTSMPYGMMTLARCPAGFLQHRAWPRWPGALLPHHSTRCSGLRFRIPDRNRTLRPRHPEALPHPSDWSRPSPSRLAIGYEISVTPLQMAMAYGALANGGKLMEPRIVKELRDPEGRTVFRSEPRVVR